MAITATPAAAAAAPQIAGGCPVCLADALVPTWTVGGYALARCRRCSHLFVAGGFDARALDQAYGADYYRADGAATGYADYLGSAELRMRGFAQRLQQVERHVGGRRGRLLDYGCAVGLFVKVAADAGWRATGYERSEWAARHGREHYGLDIVVGRGDADEPDFRQAFDVVTMWDALEHLEDPRRVLGLIARWLKPGGLLALNTVDSGSLGARLAGEHWRHIAPPHHLHYFNRHSLRRVLNDNGFHVLQMRAQGVMWEADRRRVRLGGWRAAIEDLATHWRMRPLATVLNLLDEVDAVARLERPPAG